MARYGNVLFDLDGTLMDTSPGVLKSIEFTINELCLTPISEEIKKTFIGPPIQNSFRDTFKLNEEETAKAALTFRNVYKDVFLLEAYPFDGIVELLAELKENNVKTAVSTYKREDYTLRLMNEKGFSRYFDIIKGSDMEGKLTKADIVQYCIEELGADKSDTVLIGDTVSDEISAKEKGIDFIGVTFGFGYKIESDVKQAIYVARSPAELRKFLLG